VGEVRREVAQKDSENRDLQNEVEALTGQAQFASMTANKVQELARAKLY
jgi:hypothetical protein